MADKKSAAKAAKAPEAGLPVRTPAKQPTVGPESGPSGDVVVKAAEPGPFAEPVALAHADPRTQKAQEAAQKAAEDDGKDRNVKVQATKRGFLGNKIREAGDVFFLVLDKGQTLPSWVEAVSSDDVPTTSIAHSAEAQEEVVDGSGIGHTAQSDLKGKT